MTPETRNVEWKRSWRDDRLAWICGFANARGGVLEIGKDDDGDIVGVRNVLSPFSCGRIATGEGDG